MDLMLWFVLSTEELKEEAKTKFADGKFSVEAQRYVNKSAFNIQIGHKMRVYPQHPGKYGDQTIINNDLNTGKGIIAEFTLEGRNNIHKSKCTY